MTTQDFCLCSHSAAAHHRGAGKCSQCSCSEFDLDPFLEAGPDGRPVVAILDPIERLLEEPEE